MNLNRWKKKKYAKLKADSLRETKLRHQLETEKNRNLFLERFHREVEFKDYLRRQHDFNNRNS